MFSYTFVSVDSKGVRGGGWGIGLCAVPGRGERGGAVRSEEAGSSCRGCRCPRGEAVEKTTKWKWVGEWETASQARFGEQGAVRERESEEKEEKTAGVVEQRRAEVVEWGRVGAVGAWRPMEVVEGRRELPRAVLARGRRRELGRVEEGERDAGKELRAEE